nr:M17 family peptidase N-terminal domain-containing protein [Barrientosiimonas endolithica]
MLLAGKNDDGVALIPTHGLADESVEHVNATLAAIGAGGGPDETIKLTGVPGVASPLVVVSGTGLTGEPKASDHETIRAAAGAAVRGLAGTKHVALTAPGPSSELAGAVAEERSSGHTPSRPTARPPTPGRSRSPRSA